MKTYEVTMYYEYQACVNKKDIIKYFINNFGMSEKQAKKHFKCLTNSDIQKIIVCNNDWGPTCIDDFTFIDFDM